MQISRKETLKRRFEMIYGVMAPMVQATKAIIYKMDYFKLKSFYIANEAINKVNKQSSQWE